MLKTLPAVIPGRAEGANPESRKAGNPDVLDSGPAAISALTRVLTRYRGVPE
jgi:hypothetical protein